MGTQFTSSDHSEGGETFRCVGSLTIARAASTQREIDALLRTLLELRRR